MGDQWDGGPMRWGTNESGGPMRSETNGMGDAWVLIGAPMRWGTDELGTNETGNQWEGGPMRWGTIGIGRWWSDEWKGGPMRWGTSDMGDQWDGVPMSSNNVLGDQWVGGPMRRGPMRWGTNKMGDQWADPIWSTGGDELSRVNFKRQPMPIRRLKIKIRRRHHNGILPILLGLFWGNPLVTAGPPHLLTKGQ